MHEQIAQIIAEHAGVPLDKVTPLATLAGDLDLDSLDRVELAMRLEDRFHIKIDDRDVDDRKHSTVAGLIELVQDKICVRATRFASLGVLVQTVPFAAASYAEATDFPSGTSLLAKQADDTAMRHLRCAFEAGWNACADLTPEPTELRWDDDDDSAWQRYRANL